MSDVQQRWPLKILLVEDEMVNRVIMVNLLTRYAEVVQEATDGIAALRLLETFPADLVITDLSMPRMDGISLIREMRRRNYGQRVLVLTALDETAKISGMELISTSDILYKPLKLPLLVNAVAEVAVSLGMSPVA